MICWCNKCVQNYLGCYLPLDGEGEFEDTVLSQLDDYVQKNNLGIQLAQIHQSLGRYTILIPFSDNNCPIRQHFTALVTCMFITLRQ